MQGKVHVAIGTATVACLLVKYPMGFDLNGVTIIPAISLVTAAAGSYAPDIDSTRTHAGMKHKVTSKVVNKVGGGHRGITHTLLVPAITLVLMYLANSYLVSWPYIASIVNSLIFGFAIGYIMHLFADMFNGKGIPLFWPLMKGKVHIMDLPSSGFVPWLFALILVGIMAVLTFGGVF